MGKNSCTPSAATFTIICNSTDSPGQEQSIAQLANAVHSVTLLPHQRVQPAGANDLLVLDCENGHQPAPTA